MSSLSQLDSKLARSHLPALDGLRAVAVFLVIIAHFGFVMVPGAHGVMTFFVLSGFLITWLLLRENETTGDVSLSGFYKRRTLRIFPAFYFYWLTLVSLLIITRHPVPWSHAFSALSYTSNYYLALSGDPNNGFSHTWSLAIEEQFYLLWPAIFILFRRNLRRMTTLLMCIIAAIWVYRIVLCFGFGIDQGYIQSAFDTRFDALMVGCLIAVLLKRNSIPSLWRRVTASSMMPLATIALLMMSVYAGELYIDRYRDVIGFAIEPLLVGIFIVQMIALSSTKAWSWLESRPARFLGRISYSLYLYQQLTLYSTRKALSGFPIVVQLGGAIAVTVVAATLSHYFVERPFLKMKAGWPQLRQKLVLGVAER
jgi:peptidoglycan/LPS O-acetylase OafA/YrhL